MTKPFTIFLSLRILLIVLTGSMSTILVIYEFYLSGIGGFIFVIIQGILLFHFVQKQFLSIERHLDCLIHGDFTNPEGSIKKDEHVLRKLSTLNSQLRKQSSKQYSEFYVFSNILESLRMGVLIIENDHEKGMSVYAINEAFLEILNIPKLTEWNLLSKQIEVLMPFLEYEKWENLNHIVSLTTNNQEENFLMKTSITESKESSFLILTLETIQQLIEKKEKESWYKLMNVMSHEILNTITPIKSLAENLQYLIDGDANANEIEPEDLKELSHGLSIINKRSIHLTKFVESYRQLTSLPKPKLEWISLHELINETLTLFKPNFDKNGIDIEVDDLPIVQIQGDKTQLEQVFINIFSNAISGLENASFPKLTIKIEEEQTRVLVKISDNGIGIPEEIQSNIFVPYFTTRKGGSGIGLTLSKSIMNAHNGHVYLENGQDPTVFVLSFVI